MGPPNPGCQQLVHLLCPEVSCKLAAVCLIEQQLPTRSGYHQPGRLIRPTIHKFDPMHLPHVKLCVRAACSAAKFPHFHISVMPRGLMDTCQIRWLDLQRQNLINDTNTWRPTCCPKIKAMCQRSRYTLPLQGRSFQAASTLMACIRHVPHVAGHLLLSSCSHWHPAHVQCGTLQEATQCS